MEARPSQELLRKLQAKQEALFLREALELYIPSQIGRYAGDQAPQDAWTTIQHWLADPNSHCLLLLGDSGAGKTLFGQWLASQAWQNGWDKNPLQNRIPLFVPLLSQENPESDLIKGFLKESCDVTDESEQNLIKQQPLLLILDGFDEIPRKANLYRTNQLWRLPHLKIIISCRSQALLQVSDYRQLFYPYDDAQKPSLQKFQELVMAPFNEQQINAYFQKYVELHAAEIKQSLQAFKTALDWTKHETYQTHVQKLPGLKSLLTSPFVLSLVASVLPTMVGSDDDQKQVERLQLARINLYDHFIAQWFTRQKKKLWDAKRIDEACPIEEAFREYSKRLAHEMLQAGVTRVKYKPPVPQAPTFFASTAPTLVTASDDQRWEPFFNDDNILVGHQKINLSLIRAGCPLIKLGEHQYAFLHKSLLEYFAARKLFEGAMIGASIALGIELNEKRLTNEPDTLRFFAERVKQDKALEAQLFAVLQESKYEERVQVAAANAITILNYAEVCFSGRDLRRIRIQGADLSYAILDSTDLQEADLRDVNLRAAWLKHAKLGGAILEGVYFGERAYLKGDNPIDCVAYSPNGKWLASGSSRGNIRIWEVETGKLVKTLKGHAKNVNSLAFSPDGNRLASGSEDNTICLWDTQTYREITSLAGHSNWVQSVAFSPNGNLLASGSDDRTIRIWDIQTYREITTLAGHSGSVSSVAFSPDGNLLASGSWDSTIRLWDTRTYREITSLAGHSSLVTSIAFSPDGNLLASGSSDNTIRLWDTQTYREITSLAGHSGSVKSVAFSPDGNLLASGSWDKTIRLWDTQTYREITTLAGHSGEVTSIAFSPDGNLLASGSWEDTIRLWDTQTYREITSLAGHSGSVKSVAFSPDGNLLASGSWDNTIRLWDTQTYREITTLAGHSSLVTSIAFSPDGNLLASGSWDKTIRLWDTQTYREITTLAGHSTAVTSVAFSPDGNLLASGSWDKTIRLWDTQTYREITTLAGHSNWVQSVAFSPNGNLLASGSDDNTVRLWDTQTYREITSLAGHSSLVTSIAFSPDGNLLASGSWDKTIRLWDTQTYREITSLAGHSSLVTSIAFSPDGNLLASGSWDKTIRLWDINARSCITICSLTYPINSLCWQVDQEKIYLYAASGTGIYHFILKNHQLILLYRISRDRGLMCDHLNLGGVIGLDPQNHQLLEQRGAVGKLSTKLTGDIINERRLATPYDIKQRNLFTGHFAIHPQSAIVSMIRKKAGKGSEHTFLVIEYVESSHYNIIRADFFLDEHQAIANFGLIKKGYGRVEMQPKNLQDMQTLRNTSEWVCKCWNISLEKAHELLNLLAADRTKKLIYYNLGDGAVHSAVEPGEEKHNCVTWCESRLTAIGIDVSQQQSWLDVIVSHPARHLPAPEEPTSNARCSVM